MKDPTLRDAKPAPLRKLCEAINEMVYNDRGRVDLFWRICRAHDERERCAAFREGRP